MEPTFPLLRLPENAIVHVLKNMNLNQLLIFSLVSSKIKRLVTSLSIEANDVTIAIFSKISVIVHTTKSHLTLNFYDDSNNQNEVLPVDISLPVAASFNNEDRTIQSSTPFNLSDWLHHIQLVLCCNQPLNIYFDLGCERFEIESLKEIIGSIRTLIPNHLLTNDSSRNVLKCFNTPNKLYLFKNPFEDTSQIQQIFIKNYNGIVFRDVYSLDDMLLINSEEVNFYRPISQKQFNRFVKHWIRGSNPRLQYMFLKIDKTDFVSREMLLKGIQCVDVGKEKQQEICQNHSIGIVSYYMVAIRRKDGTPAVIATKEFQNVIFIRFIVLY
ncbi:hypothetical protein GCK72_008545 [Caenorhabditis remanei]|uniref:F-box domain-containing protein n=1 Tax=Caenorhabditis remanei TaxID=31234 RepID=A0A6A5GXV0_CAERE|nr:hypothetical protein GCK72_008545 [Caenorhabditis remanei]KAF1760298.1 hypothetical protein GCK72_008545 [Caenorhabditis remanei]